MSILTLEFNSTVAFSLLCLVLVLCPWLAFQWPGHFLLLHFYLHGAWPREEPWVVEQSDKVLQMGHVKDREDSQKWTRMRRAIQTGNSRSKVSGTGMQIQDQM